MHVYLGENGSQVSQLQSLTIGLYFDFCNQFIKHDMDNNVP